jgi:hypothetical protein
VIYYIRLGFVKQISNGASEKVNQKIGLALVAETGGPARNWTLLSVVLGLSGGLLAAISAVCLLAFRLGE